MKDWHSSSLAWLQLLSGQNSDEASFVFYFLFDLLPLHTMHVKYMKNLWTHWGRTKMGRERIIFSCMHWWERDSLFSVSFLCKHACVCTASAGRPGSRQSEDSEEECHCLLWSGLLGWLNLCHMTSAKGHGLKPNHCTYSDSYTREMQHVKVTEKTDFPFEEAAEEHTLWRGGWQTDSHAWATSCMRWPSEKPAVSK